MTTTPAITITIDANVLTQALAQALAGHMPPASPTSPQPAAPVFLTVAGAAELLKCSPTTIYQAVSTGDLPATRLGRALRIKQTDLDQWIEAQSGMSR